MRAHKSSRDIHSGGFAESFDYGKLFEFGFEIESVAAFDFDRSDSVGLHFEKMTHSLSEKLVLGGFSRLFRGIGDTAAPFHNFHIILAVHTEVEFFFSVSAENEVGMRIDKCRKNARSFAIVFMCLGIELQGFIFLSYENEFAVIRNERAVFYSGNVVHRRAFFCFRSPDGNEVAYIVK